MSETERRAIYDGAIGTIEEGRALLGRRSGTNYGALPADESRVAQFCSAIEDGNPSYWDAALSARLWGRPIAPPAMLQGLTRPLEWSPDGPPKLLDQMVMQLPLPGSDTINISTDAVYHRPIYIGETLSFHDVATEISERKETRLGTGYFATTVGNYHNERGEHVATITNIHFRFDPAGGA